MVIRSKGLCLLDDDNDDVGDHGGDDGLTLAETSSVPGIL